MFTFGGNNLNFQIEIGAKDENMAKRSEEYAKKIASAADRFGAQVREIRAELKAILQALGVAERRIKEAGRP